MGIFSFFKDRRKALNREASLRNKQLALAQHKRVCDVIDEIYFGVLREQLEKPEGSQPLRDLFEILVEESKAWGNMINACDASLSGPADDAFREVEVFYKKAREANARSVVQAQTLERTGRA